MRDARTWTPASTSSATAHSTTANQHTDAAFGLGRFRRLIVTVSPAAVVAKTEGRKHGSPTSNCETNVSSGGGVSGTRDASRQLCFVPAYGN